MPVFDCHTHIFPDKVSAEALRVLSERSGVAPATDATRDGLIASMAAAGIDGALNCPIATAPRQVTSINDWAIAGNVWPVLSLGTLHPDMEAPGAEVERLATAGVPGVKLHPEYQAFRLEEARMTPVWEACAALGMVVLLHCGADIGFPPPYHTSPETVAELLARFPRLTVIAAHFGGWQMWDRVGDCLLGTPAFLDVSYTVGFLPDERLAALIRSHGTERVLFGTDSPWSDQAETLRAVRRLPLAEEELDTILWHSAAAILPLPDAAATAGDDGDEPAATMPDAKERDALLRLPDDELLAACRLDSFRGSGRGGQKRNTTESAVRLTHEPTGLSATCDASRSQATNRRLCLRRLRLEIALNCRAAPTSRGNRSPCPSRKSAAFAVWAARVLDALEAAGYRVGAAAAALGTGTGRLVKDLAGEPALWQRVLDGRKRHDLPPLRRPE